MLAIVRCNWTSFVKIIVRTQLEDKLKEQNSHSCSKLSCQKIIQEKSLQSEKLGVSLKICIVYSW